MTQEHLITPPPELIQHWLGNYFGCIVSGELSPSETFLATQAAQWGADQELEACIQWIQLHFDGMRGWCDDLRAARRPKPPSLKEQALDALTLLCKGPDAAAFVTCRDTIRRALESIPD